MFNHLAFIGGGHITRCLLSGLKDKFSSSKISVSNPTVEKLQSLADDFNIIPAENNTTAVSQAETVLLAVKPQIVQSVCEEVASTVREKRPLIISLATAIHSENIHSWLHTDNLPVIRVMTNTATAVNKGNSVLFANSFVTKAHKDNAEELFSSLGNTVWVTQEEEINTFTPLVGCMPAFLFLQMEAIIKAACRGGIQEEDARRITLQGIVGAAELAKSSQIPVEILRDQVTTPRGVTEHAIAPLLVGNYFNLWEKALSAGKDRCEEIEKTYTPSAQK